MRKIYDPKKMAEQIKKEIEAKKKEQKRGVKTTTISYTDEKTGKKVEKKLSASEMNKLRLEMARKQDEELYRNERTTPLDGSPIPANEEE